MFIDLGNSAVLATNRPGATYMELISLNAGNDRNGNPRRVYVLLGNGHVKGVWNEGYAGIQAVPSDIRDGHPFPPSFRTTPAQYRELLKWAKQNMPPNS